MISIPLTLHLMLSSCSRNLELFFWMLVRSVFDYSCFVLKLIIDLKIFHNLELHSGLTLLYRTSICYLWINVEVLLVTDDRMKKL